MAAISNATTVAVVNDTILSEQLDLLARHGVRTPYLFQGFAVIPPNIVNTETYKASIFGQIGAATAHTETDEVPVAELEVDVPYITIDEYAVSIVISDRAQRLSPYDIVMQAAEQVMDSCYRKIESDALALAGNMSNGQGSAATVFTAENFNSVLTSFTAQGKASAEKPVMVMSTSAMRDLSKDAMTNAAALYGSLFGPQLVEAANGLGGNLGQWRELGQLRLAATDGLPTGDTTGKTSFVCHVDRNAPAINVVFGKGVTFELSRTAERLADRLIGSVDFGAGIMDEDRCYYFITKA